MDELYQKIKDLRSELNTVRRKNESLIAEMVRMRTELRKAKQEIDKLSAATEKKSAELPPEFKDLFGGIFKGGK